MNLEYFVKKLLIKFVRLYQIILSPLAGRECRFFPSCSEYGIESLEKYGPLRGVYRATTRLLRCNRLFEGGIDLP